MKKLPAYLLIALAISLLALAQKNEQRGSRWIGGGHDSAQGAVSADRHRVAANPTGDEIVISVDPDRQGSYLAYKVRLGTYVQVQNF